MASAAVLRRVAARSRASSASSSACEYDWEPCPEHDDRDRSDDREDERSAIEVPDARNDHPEDDRRRHGRNRADVEVNGPQPSARGRFASKGWSRGTSRGPTEDREEPQPASRHLIRKDEAPALYQARAQLVGARRRRVHRHRCRRRRNPLRRYGDVQGGLRPLPARACPQRASIILTPKPRYSPSGDPRSLRDPESSQSARRLKL